MTFVEKLLADPVERGAETQMSAKLNGFADTIFGAGRAGFPMATAATAARTGQTPR